MVYNEADGRFLASGGNGRLIPTLLLIGFNCGSEVLRDKILSRFQTLVKHKSSRGMKKIVQCDFSVNQENLQYPPEAGRCSTILDKL